MGPLETQHEGQFEDQLSSLYLTMLRLGTPTRDGLVAAGVHPDDIDRGAPFLVSRQLISPAGEGEWEIVPPETSLPRLASALEARARATRTTAGELGAIWRQSITDPSEAAFIGVDMLRSVDQVVHAAYALAATAEERIRMFLDDSPAARQLILEQPTAITRPPLPPSAIWLVVDVALFAHDGVLRTLEAAAASGQRVVVADGLPFTGLVVDDKAALVDLSRHDERADGSFVVRRRPATAAVAALFDISFDLATPMGPTLALHSGESDGAPLVERDRRILGLLATGATDQQIARTLGVSTRTVERRVALVMQTLGASTRFQAGAKAVRRGWI
jgi:DNA-binding CsgD family transcriptional regulator